MRIRLYGKNKGLAPDEVRHLIEWAARRLLGDRAAKIPRINVLQKRLKNKDLGTCNAFVDQTTGKILWFRIGLNTEILRTKASQRETILHEMTHVEQYITGKLNAFFESQGGKGVVWKRKMFEDKDDGPWETEAYGKTEGLYRAYMREKRKAKCQRKTE